MQRDNLLGLNGSFIGYGQSLDDFTHEKTLF